MFAIVGFHKNSHFALRFIYFSIFSIFVRKTVRNLLPLSQSRLLFIYVKYSVASKINNITGNIEELIIHAARIYNCDLIYHFTPGENAVGRHRLAISRIVPTVLVYHFPHFSTFLAGQYLQIDRAHGRSISSNSPETNARRRQFPFNTTMCASWNAIAYAHDTDSVGIHQGRRGFTRASSR